MHTPYYLGILLLASTGTWGPKGPQTLQLRRPAGGRPSRPDRPPPYPGSLLPPCRRSSLHTYIPYLPTALSPVHSCALSVCPSVRPSTSPAGVCHPPSRPSDAQYKGGQEKGPAWVSPSIRHPVDILSCETTGSSTLSARQLGLRAHPICAESEPHLFHNTPKRGERTITRRQHVCFQCLNPSLLPSPDTALLLHIAATHCTPVLSLTTCDPP